MNRKTSQEITILRQGGRILASILKSLAKEVRPGINGLSLDKLAEKHIRQAGGRPSFKNFQGFPNSLCVSINQTVVHGIPTAKEFKAGDIVGLDLGIKYKGYYTDMAITVGVGKISLAARRLLEVTEQALDVGISQVGPGKHIGDIGKAIEKFIKPYGYSIVTALAGHGVGYDVHEEPTVPNYDPKMKLQRLEPGVVLAIEPMIIMGKSSQVLTADNKWDVITADGSLAAHFEHTVAVTDQGYEVLTSDDKV